MKRFCKSAVVVAVAALALSNSARADYVVDRKTTGSNLWIAGITVPTYEEAQGQAAQIQSRGHVVRIRQVGPQRPQQSQPQQQPQAQGQGVEIWTVPVWYAAPGKQWAIYGTYFVYRYSNGFTDNSEPLEVAQALNRSGYFSNFDNKQATFQRMGSR